MKKNSTFKRFLAFLLCAAMLITYMPSSVYTLAYEGDVAANEESDETPTQENADPVEEGSQETTSETTKGSDNVAPEGNQTVTQPNDTNGGNSDAGNGSEQPAEGETPAVKDGGDDADAYPEQSFEKTLDGLTIKVAAEKGAFPAGTDMTIESADMEKVIAAIGQNEGAKAVKIAFQDKDDNAIEPAEAGKVSVTVDADNLEEGKTYKVFHLDNDNNATEATLSEAFKTDDLVFAVVGVEEESDTKEPSKAPKRVADGETAEMITVTFDPRTEEGDAVAPITIEVAKGSTIGDKLPDVPAVPGYRTKWVIENTTTPVTAETVVEEAFTAVVDKSDKIKYTVTFVQEDGTTETREATIDTGFAVNDVPNVTPKLNKVGKWVYPGTTDEFTVGTVVSEDLTVNAYYEQNIFTVKFMVDNAQYEEMTTATGTKIVLPSDPIKAGATFSGWFTEPDGEGTQYTAESTVSEDLTLYAYFADQVRVSFIVRDSAGEIINSKSQYYEDVTVGGQISTLPDDPFIEGEVFDHWENEENGDVVEAGYTVTKSFNAVAVFKDIDTYELTVKYFYINGKGDRIDIGTQVYDLVEKDFPYTVTAPSSQTTDEHTSDPVYYPSQATITVDLESAWQDGTGDDAGKKVLVIEDEYVAPNASYTVNHYLNGLDGGEPDLIEAVPEVGVKNSHVTPAYNTYSYADPDHRDSDVVLTGDDGQELNVYYARKNFTLSYNVGGGEYIDAVTAPYGTTITLPTNAERAGYTFDGWYKNSDYSGTALTTYTLDANTTLYAKWTPAQSEYKIVYMIENADDNGYSYLATVTKTAPTDSKVTMTAATAGASGTRPSELDTTNFTFKDSTTETISADGTTVVTVRYSRNVYTITWNGMDRRHTGMGDYWEYNQGNASLTAKYGANISKLWQETFNDPYPNNAWNFSQSNNNDKFTSLDIMPSGNKTVYRWYYTTTKTQYLNYWLENYDTTLGSKSRNGHNYGLLKGVTSHYNWLEETDYPNYAGYTKAGMVRSDGKTGYGNNNNGTFGNRDVTVDFYYNAEKYPLTFYNYNGELISTQDVTLGNNIYSYLNSNIPDAPMEGATWLGWYTDQGHAEGSEYTYTQATKMPAGLVLYAAFQFPTRKVTFDSQGGSAVDAQEDEYGFLANAPTDPTKENYTFQGWFTAADETGSPYDWNQPVTEDITLYAHWAQKTISYTVHYYVADSTTEVLPDKIISDPEFRENQEITENAPTVAGYVSDKASVTKALSFNDEDNEITFYYSQIPNELTYTVRYVLQGTDIEVAETKTVKVPGTTTNALEKAVEVDSEHLATQTTDPDILGKHYKPTETSKELQLALTDNVITFEYVPYTTTKITVNYLDMDGETIGKTDVNFVEKGDTFTLLNKAPEGFVYHHAYLDGTTTAPQATYQITGNEGDLVINVYYQKKLIILAKSKTKIYDGNPLVSQRGIEDATITGLARGDEVTSVEYDGSQTDAGISPTTPKNAEITLGDTGKVAPEEYYSIVYVPGSLTVKPVSVYISISADQWNTHSGGSGPNYYTGQTFNVGFTNPNKQHFNDDTSKSAYVSITSGQRTLFKDKYGDAIWSALYGENGALISQKDAGTYTVTGAQQRAMVAGVEVDGKAMMSDRNFSIVINARDSFLKIDPLPLTIKTPDAEKPYDGEALTKSEGATLDHSYWTANIGGTWTKAETAAPGEVTLGTGETITFNVTGSQTPVGSDDNTYSIDWGENKSSNYSITADLGTLSVTPAALTVTVNDKTSAVYTGEEQEGYTFPESVTGTGAKIDEAGYTVEGLGKGDVLTIAYTPAKGTNVNTYTGAFATTYTIVNEKGEDVTANYATKTFNPGKLTIAKAPLTITVKDQTYTYNGAAQGENNATYTDASKVTVGGLKGGDALTSITLNGQETNAGEYAGKIVASAAEIGESTGNYEIQYVAGKLTINKASLTITAKDQTYTYNGAEQGEDNKTYTDASKVTVEGLKGEDALTSITLNGQETNVGEYGGKIVASAAEIGESTGNYNITYAPGKLTINKATLNITVKPQTYTYNGSAQGENAVTYTDATKISEKVEASGLQGNDALTSITLDGQETNANVYSGKIVASDAVVGSATSNYNIVYTPGTLTINKAAVTVAANPAGKEYGEPEPPLTAKVTGLVGQDTVEYAVSREEGEDVGEYDITATGEKEQGNYTVTYLPSTFTITKGKVVVTANPASKVYGAKDPTLTATVTGLKNGDDESVIKYTLKRAEGENVDTYTITASGEAEQGNYDVEFVNGTFAITPAPLTITAKDQTYTYNGEAQGEDNATYTDASKVTVEGLKGEDALTSITLNGQETNVGEYDGKIVASAAEIGDSTGNYEITYVAGKLTIEKAALTITAKDQTYTYNGEAQGEDNATYTDASKVTVEGLKGEDALTSITLNGQETNVGEYDGKIVASAAEIGDSTGNYEITYVAGKLTINPLAITVTITGHFNSTNYDGEEHTVTGYDAEASSELYDVENDFTFSGTDTASRTDEGKTMMDLKEDQFENTNDNFTVTFEVTDGYQEIVPVEKVVVTIVGKNSTLPYDGEEHSVSGYEVSISNPLYKESDFTFTPSESADLDDDNVITARRTDAGTTNMGLAAGQFANKNSNFKEVEFVVTDGYQTITPIDVAVTITGHTSTVPYDGTEHSVSGYDVEIGNPLYKEADFTFSGTVDCKTKFSHHQ